MDFDEYQQKASTTAVYPGQGSFIGLAYAILGLNGEAGETGEQVKKIWRDEASDIEATIMEAVDTAHASLKNIKMTNDGTMNELREAIGRAFKIEISEDRREKILKELGDNLWYAAQVCTELNASMDEVAQGNIDKLALRRVTNTIHGEE